MQVALYPSRLLLTVRSIPATLGRRLPMHGPSISKGELSTPSSAFGRGAACASFLSRSFHDHPYQAHPFADDRFSRFYGGPAEREGFVRELTRVLHDHGFFYLTGHGVPQSLIDDVLAASKRFFALPEAEKLSIEMVKSPHFRGYNRAGYERTRGEQDWREQLDINTEGTAIETAPATPWNRLYGPNQWPAAQPELKQLLLRYQAEVTRIGIDVLKAIALSLGQPEDAFAEIYEPSPSQLLKIIRYPGREAAGSDQGVGAHKDGGFVTVLLQDTTPGLRIRTEEGVWIEAPPVPGTFIINSGELLELATNGFVRADVHDVVAAACRHRAFLRRLLPSGHATTRPSP